MLVFSTRLPLKDGITQENCIGLFMDWIRRSPHYGLEHLTYDVESLKDCDFFGKDDTKVFFRHYKNESDHIEIFACRLESRSRDALWINDCIFLDENHNKSILIQLNRNSEDYNTYPLKVKKPYIVRMLVEGGYCRSDGVIPVTDTPLEVEKDYYDVCVDIMNGKCRYSMPAVYLSCDYIGAPAVSATYMARALSGVAHVFIERDHDTALRLRDDTNGNNAHTGYVGVYFPGTTYCQKHSIDYYERDDRKLSKEVIDAVWKALVNRLDSSNYNWNQILTMQAKQTLMAVTDHNNKQLEAYMESFDSENNDLKEKIDKLSMENYGLQAQLDSFRASASFAGHDSGFFNSGEEPNLYASEKAELLYSILSQIQNRFKQDSRGYVLIESLLAANPTEGECKRIVDSVKRIFGNGGKLSQRDISELKGLGFVFEDNHDHYKMYFHDRRYMFTVAKTPSDHRNGENMISDICKMIDINRKI